MSEPAAAAPRRGLTPAIWIGLALWAFTLAWWLYYYSQYGGVSDQLLMKIPCLAVSTDDCVYMQKHLAESAIPAYHPVLFWVGAAVLILGFLQRRSRRG
jgi:hypothetical protein